MSRQCQKLRSWMQEKVGGRWSCVCEGVISCVINSTDHSEEMVAFIENAPQGSLLFMVTHDDGSAR